MTPEAGTLLVWHEQVLAGTSYEVVEYLRGAVGVSDLVFVRRGRGLADALVSVNDLRVATKAEAAAYMLTQVDHA